MSKKIYDAVSENFVRRMRNWALTNAGAFKDRSTISSIYSIGSGNPYGESGTPVLIGESEDVNQALSTMPARYKQAVMLFWQYEGQPMTYLACRCGTGLDWRTYEKRVIYGHELLKAEIARQQEKAENYRQALRNLHLA